MSDHTPQETSEGCSDRRCQPPPLPARPPVVRSPRHVWRPRSESEPPIWAGENLVSVQCADGQRFWLAEPSAKLSTFVADALADDPGTVELPATVDAATLRLVVDWLEHHHGVAPLPPIQSPRSSHVVISNLWDAKFIHSVAEAQLCRLALAAHDLGIEGLLRLACLKIAALLRGVPICGTPGAKAVRERWLSICRSEPPAASSL